MRSSHECNIASTQFPKKVCCCHDNLGRVHANVHTTIKRTLCEQNFENLRQCIHVFHKMWQCDLNLVHLCHCRLTAHGIELTTSSNPTTMDKKMKVNDWFNICNLLISKSGWITQSKSFHVPARKNVVFLSVPRPSADNESRELFYVTHFGRSNSVHIRTIKPLHPV